MGKLVLTNDDMVRCFNALASAQELVYDVETSGLNPRKNHTVGYVLTVGPAPDDTFYVPIRHAGTSNCLGWQGLTEAEDLDVKLHPFEIEFAKVAARKDLLIVGHNLVFDLLFSARKDIYFGGRVECTQVLMALIDEFLPSFSLDNCARTMRVTEKLGQDLYHHLHKLFVNSDKEMADKKMMKYFWRLAGNDEIGVDYAMGDGTSTWELRKAQEEEIMKQDLRRVWDVECRVTKTLFRMQHHGMRVNPDNLDMATKRMTLLIDESRSTLPSGLNVRSGPQMKALFDKEGITNYPTTSLGNPSFTEDWLDTTELGRRVIGLRKLTNLMNSFINPVVETHMWNGSIYPQYAQLGSDEFGTITGRLSSYSPNIQQVPKRNEKLGRIFRSIFVPDDGMTWCSNDYSQCEPRLYTEYSGSPLMIAGYTSDPPVDFYQTLANITGKPRSPTAGIAGNCKQLALSIFYGAGDKRTAEMLGIPFEEAVTLRRMVRQMVPEIGDFANNAKRRAEYRRYVMTVLGRRARFKVGDNTTFKAGGRIIQGGNADLVKLSLVNVDDYLISENCPPPLATVHDSIENQVPQGREDINQEVVKIMQDTAKNPPLSFTIPHVVDNGTGPNWSIATYGEEHAG